MSWPCDVGLALRRGEPAAAACLVSIRVRTTKSKVPVRVRSEVAEKKLAARQTHLIRARTSHRIANAPRGTDEPLTTGAPCRREIRDLQRTRRPLYGLPI